MAIDRWSGLGAVLAVGLAIDLAVGLAFGLAIGLDAEGGFRAGVAPNASEPCDYAAPVPLRPSEDRSTALALDRALSMAGENAWALVEGPCAVGACRGEMRLVDLDRGPSREFLVRRPPNPPFGLSGTPSARAPNGSPHCAP